MFVSRVSCASCAKRDADGRYRIIGRVDDVINVSGHRFGTALGLLGSPPFEASDEDLATRRGAGSEHSRSYVTSPATKYGRQRPSRSQMRGSPTGPFIENAINQAKGVVESAVVGFPHDIKGQGIYAYVVTELPIPADDTQAMENMRGEILEAVVASIGRIAKPDKIQFVSGLPKTLSGKIMRRILRKVAENELGSLGDTSTLLDPAVVEEIKGGRV